MKATFDAILPPAQARYLEALEPPRDALLARMEAIAHERGLPMSDPEVATFLAVAVRAASPRFLVELGTNIGYGAIVLARAAGEGARVLTVERSPELCREARGFVAEAGLGARIDVREGDAIAVLEAISEPVDFAYIDCVKEDYPRYLELLVPRLSARGVLVADNVLWRGLVASNDVPPGERARTDALRAFNRALVAHPGLRAVVLALGDGVAYAVRSPKAP